MNVSYYGYITNLWLVFSAKKHKIADTMQCYSKHNFYFFFFFLLFCHFNTPLIEHILLQLLRSVCMFADPQLQKHKHAHTALHIWTVIQMVVEDGTIEIIRSDQSLSHVRLFVTP